MAPVTPTSAPDGGFEWPPLPAMMGFAVMVLALLGVLVFRLAAAGLLLGLVLLRSKSEKAAGQSDHTKQLKGRETVAFFHPYARAGGGGERVLWCAVRALQKYYPGVVAVVYSGDTGVSGDEMLAHARSHFGLDIDPKAVHFVFLTSRHWVDAVSWPRFTLLGQSFGSLILAWEALCEFRPNVVIDSMGYAFAMAFCRLVGSCRVGCYVHYPTISTDMLQQVRNRGVAICNDSAVARSRLLSAAKLIYYRIFAALYGLAGRQATVVLVNSSWTRGHIDDIWRIPARTLVVYPPCDVSALAALPLQRGAAADGPASWTIGGLLVLSLAQFRPEKDHALQLRAFARFLRQAPSHCREPGHPERVRLVLAGGCRNQDDRRRVEELRLLCRELGLKEGMPPGGGESPADWDVRFRLDVPLDEVKALLGRADVGLHTMRDEHFGINVVEFMAAGAVALAHNSAGPALDILTPFNGQRTGYLASDEEGYAAALAEILLDLGEQGRRNMAEAARQAACQRFGQDDFENAIASRLVGPLRAALPRSGAAAAKAAAAAAESGTEDLESEGRKRS